MKVENKNMLDLYEKQGFCIVDFDNVLPLKQAQAMLNKQLKELTSKDNICLDNYHEFITDNNHENIQWKLSNFFWDQNLCKLIALQQINVLKNFIGYDILIQERPFLRIARPNKTSDNIGFHRDTLYGQSPYEVAVHVPLVDLDLQSCLRFLPYSHTDPESKYKINEIVENIVVKGSKKHEMGHPYAPKKSKIDNNLMLPQPLKLGQAVIFPPSTMHGQEINLAEKTRFSYDFRIVSPYAPINIRKDFSSRGYTELNKSVVTKVAEEYHKSNTL